MSSGGVGGDDGESTTFTAEAVAKVLSQPGRGWSNGDMNEKLFAHSRVGAINKTHSRSFFF